VVPALWNGRAIGLWITFLFRAVRAACVEKQKAREATTGGA
jgi:hypothetical protein